MLTVCCVKQGTLYSADYVNILAWMIRRNLTPSYEFVCFTDDATGLDQNIRHRPIAGDLEGWWGKLSLFAPGVFDGRVLFFDLDTVIIGSLDGVARYDGPFAILRDFLFPKRWQSAVMAWEPSAITERIWFDWDEAGRPRINGGDQAWISQSLCRSEFKPDIWQDLCPGTFVSYKADCFYCPPNKAAKIVCFHGEPRPHECKRQFITEAWRC